MTFKDKIIFLNRMVDDTLALTHYHKWEVASYGRKTFFAADGPVGPICSESLTECVDIAIQRIHEVMSNV